MCLLVLLQVEGFKRQQLASLFNGTTSHLLAYVSSALAQQPQQHHHPQPPYCGPLGDCDTAPADTTSTTHGNNSSSSKSRRRRNAPAEAEAPGTASATVAAAAAEVGGSGSSEDAAGLRRQVAAAVAAHVTARVPLSSGLVPAVLELLQDEVSTC